MNTSEVLTDGYRRISELVVRALNDATPEMLAFRPDPDANSVAWLVWHLSRVQDSHIAEVLGEEQRWNSQGWVERFGLPLEASSTGFGHTSEQVASVGNAKVELLRDYHDDVFEHTASFLAGLGEPDLDRVVDTRWDPPVTLGVRLVSVLSDNLQHAGQALFVRGISERVAQ